VPENSGHVATTCRKRFPAFAIEHVAAGYSTLKIALEEIRNGRKQLLMKSQIDATSSGFV
jgi:hypothetical protein